MPAVVVLRRSARWFITGERRGYFSEYRFDVVGRRVLVRTRRDGLCNTTQTSTVDCTSGIERYVWAGDNILWEMRGPGAHNETAERLEQESAVGVEYGIVGYTHAGGVDRPQVAYKTAGGNVGAVVVPHMNWRGLFSMGTNPSGGASTTPVEWSGFRTTAWHYTGETQSTTRNWMGSLLDGQRDAGGQMYMRNRYYDPAAGQFTQTDPIGIAGGLNTYGFAAGDPVGNWDPFGLCSWGIGPDAAFGRCGEGDGASDGERGDDNRGEDEGPGVAAVVCVGGLAVTGLAGWRALSADRRLRRAERRMVEQFERQNRSYAAAQTERTAAARKEWQDDNDEYFELRRDWEAAKEDRDFALLELSLTSSTASVSCGAALIRPRFRQQCGIRPHAGDHNGFERTQEVSVNGRLWVNIIGLCMAAFLACFALTPGVRGVMRHRDLLGLASIGISLLIAVAFGLAFAVGVRRRGNPDARFLVAGFLLVVLQSVLDAIRF